MKITALLVAAASMVEARFEDVQAFETFDATSCVTRSTFTKVNAVYPESMTMRVPFRGEELELQVSVDRSIFAEDWALVDDSGKVLSSDKEAWMCHYVGSVVGKKGSTVTISVCNEAGMNGLIETEDFAAEIQPVDPTVSVSSLGSHIIYDMNDLVLPDDLSFEEAVGEFEDFASGSLNTTDVGSSRSYVMNLVTASDSNRMRAFSSGSAEASNTQSVVSQMNNRYTSTSWGSGNSLRIQIARQVANANMGGAPTSDFRAYLPRVATWKGNNYPNSDNVQGLTSFNQGGCIGRAYCGTMCHRSQSAGINNVGFTSSTSSRGILVAHEAGHNFGMRHDNNNRPNVMEASHNSNAQRFSSPSVNDFLRNSPKGCL